MRNVLLFFMLWNVLSVYTASGATDEFRHCPVGKTHFCAQATIANDSTLVAAEADSVEQGVALPNDLSASDVVHLRRSKFSHWKSLGVSALSVGIGFCGVSTRGLYYERKNSIQKMFGKLRGTQKIRVDDYIQYVPFTSFVNFGLLPHIPHKHTFRERLLIGATAYSAMGGMVNGLKYSIGELRPDKSSKNSFPSGHTATAFMGAELIRLEYGNYYGLGAYIVASMVGTLRMYNNRHWLNDVVGGAGIGIVSAHVAYWLYPWEKKLFRRKNKKAATSVSKVNAKDVSFLFAPSYEPQLRAPQVSLQLFF